MSAVALQARWLLPIDAPPPREAVVTIRDGRIDAVGRNTSGRPPRDLGDVAILPGLINVHTHLEFSDLALPLGRPGMSLPDWIRLVIARRAAGDAPGPAVAAGLAESVAAGVTSLADICNSGAQDYIGAPSIDLTLLHEVIGFSGPRSISALQYALERLDAPRAAEGPQVGVSPHAPYTVHPELVANLAAVSAKRKIPLAMHLAESREELELLATGGGPFQQLLAERGMWDPTSIAPGTTAADYLKTLAGAHRALVIHGNYLTPPQRSQLADLRDRVTLVYCPRTHAFFGHDRYPLDEALRLGVHLALGTDSRASNPDLDLLEEIRIAARMHPEVAPAQVFRLGTLAGAEALGCADRVGSLTVGKLANLAMVEVPPTEADPYEAILAAHGSVVQTWYCGRLVEPCGAG